MLSTSVCFSHTTFPLLPLNIPLLASFPSFSLSSFPSFSFLHSFLPSPSLLPPSFPYFLSSFHFMSIPFHDNHFLFRENSFQQKTVIENVSRDNNQPGHRNFSVSDQNLPEKLSVSYMRNT